ncbi:hypothetical protein [Brevibacillus marinus]|uniref:hypothetical protein n=1 Tax=Brevibacillus marinus TaxID=2496837 RepID=UPI000F838489|nr:hypothetical protein [Brevibacillus marinus]
MNEFQFINPIAESQMPVTNFPLCEVYIRISSYVATIQRRVNHHLAGAGLLWDALSVVVGGEFSPRDVTVGFATQGKDGRIASLELIHEELYYPGTQDPRSTLKIFLDDEKDWAFLARHIVGVQIASEKNTYDA